MMNHKIQIRYDEDRIQCMVCNRRENSGSRRDTTAPIGVKAVIIGNISTALCYRCRRDFYETLHMDFEEDDDGK